MKKYLLLALTLSLSAQAQTSNDNNTWVSVAAQTCIQQAPRNSAVQALNLNARQLRNNCTCVARDMLTILPASERQNLMRSMLAQRNLQQVGEHMMNKSEVKKAVLACSAMAWWD
ncbi:MAG: hypothetical protein ACRCV6_10585 [Formosimonas sp.]